MSQAARRGSVRAATIAFGLALTTVAWPLQPALAILSESTAVQGTFATTTLHAPTGLTASAALLLKVNLSWTATTDPRATGYQVLRATTSGGPYTQVATVLGKATTTYQDTVPLPGVYDYVLRTYYDAWTSANSNEAEVAAV